jgi:hypothetical protein
MAGGLLQLVAVGIDSIFLTSNPSITLFKVVYKRHTNFSIVTRIKQIPNIKDFNMECTYILPKEADCIHKSWLKFNISDIKIEYPKSTYKNIKELCEKYKISYITNKSDDDIISYNDYKNIIIPKFLDKIEISTNEFNNYIDYINIDNTYNTTIISEKKEKYTSTIKYCLDKLYDSYKNDLVDGSGNSMIFYKIELIKKMLSESFLYFNDTEYNYELLDKGEYLYTNYTFDNIEYIYKYAINRNENPTEINTINNWVDIYMDRLFLNVLQLTNLSEIFLIDSDSNNLQNLKYKISKFIDTLNFLIYNLYRIYNSKNINNLLTSDFDKIETQIARLNNLLQLVDLQIDKLSKYKYLDYQYKHIYDYNNIDIETSYDEIYQLLFDENNNLKDNDITQNLLNDIGIILDNLLIRMDYSLNKVNISIDSSADYSEYSNHVIQKFEYFFNNNSTSVTQNNKDLFNALNAYLKDLLNTPEFNEKIYTVDQINDILYNEYLTELTYSILGFKIYDDDFNLIAYDTSDDGVTLSTNGIIYTKDEFFFKIKMMYLSFILMYIIEAGIPFNKNMVDTSNNYLGNIYDLSKYYGTKMIDYFDKIIESNKNPLIPILNFDETKDLTTNYKSLDTYKILKKFLKNTDIIYNENSFNDNFVYKLTQTLKQNLFANIHILYNSIIDNVLTASRHNVTQITRISNTTGKDYIYKNTNLNELITEETDYYKFSFFKTFTNESSDTNKFTEIYGTSDPLLNDNFSNIFKVYQQNKNIYTTYFAEDIINNITLMSHNIAKYFENLFFTGFFSDYKLWYRLQLSGESMQKTLQNLTFDKETGKIVNIQYFYTSEIYSETNDRGFFKRPVYPSENDNDEIDYYINGNNNIFDKFIRFLTDKTKNNLAILNYIPFLTIRDFATEIYQFIISEAQNTQNDFKNIINNIHLFDFRDLDEYDVRNVYFKQSIINENEFQNDFSKQSIINENLTFKYELYREVILKCLLRINRDKDFQSGKSDRDFEEQIFDGDILRLADENYIQQFTEKYLNTSNLALFTIFRPENMIDITEGYKSELEVSEPEYDENGNINIKYVEKSIYMPLVRGIIERYRIKFLDIIKKNYDDEGNLIDSSDNYIDSSGNNCIGEFGVKKLKEFVNKILNNYIKFDDSNNINNDNFSYNTYKSNGYSFNFIDFQSINESDVGIGGLTNLKIFKTTENNYIQAASSIYSYINKQMIREYNLMYNELLLSDSYYEENLGENMEHLYYFIKSNLVDGSDNNIKYYQDDQIQYFYTYKYKNDDEFDPNNNINKIYLYDTSLDTIPTTNYTFPIVGHGFNYYSFGDDITMEKKENNIYEVSVNQNVFYYKIYDPYFNNMTLFDYEYFIIMSFLGYDIRRSTTYDQIKIKTDYVYKVPQYIQYYSNLLKIRNKFKDAKFNIMTSLEDIINTLNDYDKDTNTYLYYSKAESVIADRVKTKLLNNYKVLKDIIRTNQNSSIEKLCICQFIRKYQDIENNFIKNYTIDGLTKLIYTDNIVSGEEILDSNIYNVFENSYNFKNEIIPTNINDMINIFNIYMDFIETNLYNIFTPIYFNNYQNKSDVVRLLIFTLINNTSLDFYIYNQYDGSIDSYNNAIQELLITNKMNNYNYINSITKKANDSIELSPNTKIIFKKILSFIEKLYILPDYYKNTDILYHGSEVDILFRHIVNQDKVKYCWVPELAQYLIENISLEFDEILIDESNSNLRSLLNKLRNNFEHKKGYDIMIGNTHKLKTYNETNKGNISLRLPLEFFNYKEVNLSIPMINLLYTKAKIKFKLRKLEDLLIYDTNAIITKRPKISTSIELQNIYLEEEERKKISSSKLEFLIEKFKHYGKYYYNHSHIIDNKIRTQLRPTDPTKYILWRLKVVDLNKTLYNYIWNKNGYNIYNEHNKLNDFIVKGYENIKTIEDVKIYFNGSSREQGKAELFNLIFPNSRQLGSLDNDEYVYVFALYPLLYQPSGCANLSKLEEVVIEYTLTEEFNQKIKDNGLTIECEYWTCTYNILRYISGMCAPLFYS